MFFGCVVIYLFRGGRHLIFRVENGFLRMLFGFYGFRFRFRLRLRFGFGLRFRLGLRLRFGFGFGLRFGLGFAFRLRLRFRLRFRFELGLRFGLRLRLRFGLDLRNEAQHTLADRLDEVHGFGRVILLLYNLSKTAFGHGNQLGIRIEPVRERADRCRCRHLTRLRGAVKRRTGIIELFAGSRHQGVDLGAKRSEHVRDFVNKRRYLGFGLVAGIRRDRERNLRIVHGNQLGFGGLILFGSDLYLGLFFGRLLLRWVFPGNRLVRPVVSDVVRVLIDQLVKLLVSVVIFVIVITKQIRLG